MRSFLVLALAATAVPAVAQDTPPRPPMGRGMMAVDADGDGVVTRAELMAQTDRQFARLDADGNGTITPAEQQAERERMIAARGARGDGTMPPMGAGRAMRDRGDGPVTRDAFRARAEQRFVRLDANADGKLEAGEMRGPGMRRGGAAPIMTSPAPAPR